MSKVTIAPTKEGNLVTAYAGNQEFGYMVLAQTKSSFQNGWLKETTNRSIMKGTVLALTGFVKSNPSLELPGNIIVEEFLEDSVPENISAMHFDKSLPREEQIANYIKRAGKDGPALMKEDKRILRFTTWDQTSESYDKIIPHDNVAEINAYNASKATNEAQID